MGRPPAVAVALGCWGRGGRGGGEGGAWGARARASLGLQAMPLDDVLPGFVIMSLQCFVSEVPLPALPAGQKGDAVTQYPFLSSPIPLRPSLSPELTQHDSRCPRPLPSPPFPLSPHSLDFLYPSPIPQLPSLSLPYFLPSPFLPPRALTSMIFPMASFLPTSSYNPISLPSSSHSLLPSPIPTSSYFPPSSSTSSYNPISLPSYPCLTPPMSRLPSSPIPHVPPSHSPRPSLPSPFPLRPSLFHPTSLPLLSQRVPPLIPHLSLPSHSPTSSSHPTSLPLISPRSSFIPFPRPSLSFPPSRPSLSFPTSLPPRFPSRPSLSFPRPSLSFPSSLHSPTSLPHSPTSLPPILHVLLPFPTEMKYQSQVTSSKIDDTYFSILGQTRKKVPSLCSNDTELLRLLVSGLHVYYDDDIEETPAYTWDTLLSNIGGSLGLFIGVSLVSILEVLEFLWDVCSISLRRCRKTGKLEALRKK
ncbi:hypothetical protein C7M84_006410 [Penaeus vannamei]|uniref:Uncharacterized protein n=1 Tax=Penaeus vannamei TaxID=6689 RepID=A0A3R7P499_PENVA|nr:hypothetical protein C7M84_006410 [Penaeus vannamei]